MGLGSPAALPWERAAGWPHEDFHPRETAQHLRWGWSMKSLGFA